MTSTGPRADQARSSGPEHRTRAELEAGLDHVRASPRDAGSLAWIVRRPAEGEREVVDSGELTQEQGLVGDNWGARHNRHAPDGTPDPDKQLNLMNARAVDLVAGARERWALAGDQLYVDFDLGEENAPPGTRLALGDTAVVEVTPPPHLGCKKFKQRFGVEAMRFFNSPAGSALNLRGVNARVVTPGTVRVGDVVRKL